MAALNESEITTLMQTDHGETLVVDGVSVTGTFILGAAKNEDEPVGEIRRRTGIVRVSTSVAIDEDSTVVRAADDTHWRVTAADTEYGERVCPVTSTERTAEGLF